MTVRFEVYEDDWSSRQHKDPMGMGIEKWLNDLAKNHDDVQVVGFQHGQSIDKPASPYELNVGGYNRPYETVYVIAKVIDNA